MSVEKDDVKQRIEATYVQDERAVDTRNVGQMTIAFCRDDYSMCCSGGGGGSGGGGEMM